MKKKAKAKPKRKPAAKPAPRAKPARKRRPAAEAKAAAAISWEARELEEMAAIEAGLDRPYDMPPGWRVWVPRFLMMMAESPDLPAATRFRALEILIKIEAINRAAGSGEAATEAGFQLAEELAAARGHFAALKLGKENDPIDELARQAVAEILRLRQQIPAA